MTRRWHRRLDGYWLGGWFWNAVVLGVREGSIDRWSNSDREWINEHGMKDCRGRPPLTGLLGLFVLEGWLGGSGQPISSLFLVLFVCTPELILHNNSTRMQQRSAASRLDHVEGRWMDQSGTPKEHWTRSSYVLYSWLLHAGGCSLTFTKSMPKSTTQSNRKYQRIFVDTPINKIKQISFFFPVNGRHQLECLQSFGFMSIEREKPFMVLCFKNEKKNLSWTWATQLARWTQMDFKVCRARLWIDACDVVNLWSWQDGPKQRHYLKQERW